MSSAAEELVLLERVFLRLGSAETDEQFENVLAKFLPPVLLKLSSQQQGVRKKVMELLLHVNKRVKSRPQVQLPIDALLLQYQDPESTPFVINFTIIYLKIGFPRLPLEKQVELVPTIINSLESKPQTHQDSLLLLIVPLFSKITIPSDPEKRNAFFGLQDKPQISKYFLSFLLDLLLLPYGVHTLPASQADGQSSDNIFPAPPGMSEFTFKRVTGETPIKPEELEQIKLGIVKFLSNDIFLNEDIILPLIVAAADTRFSVANLADMELKKVAGLVDWTSSTLSMRLFMLFLGTTNQNLRANLKKTPANTRIRLKLLNYLNRVTGNGFVVPLSIFLIFESLYGFNTNTKLKTLALTFASNLVQYADENKLSGEADVLKFGMIKLTNEGEFVHQGKAFVILGLIGRRFPKLVYHDITIIELFLKKLGESPAELKLQIREGALNVISAYKYDVILEEIDKNDRLNILFLLMKAYVKSEESMVRFVVVRCLATIFAPNHVPSKYLLLVATGDMKDEVSNEAVKALYGTARKADVDLSKNDNTKEGKNTTMPNFIDMTNYIYTEAQLRLQDKNEKVVYGVHVLPFSIKIFIEILTYLRLCLIRSLNVPLTREIMKHPTEDTPIIRNYLQSIYSKDEPIESNPLLQYASITKQLLVTNQAIEPLCCMVEIIGCVPQLHTLLQDQILWLRDLTMTSKEEVREFASLLYGIVASESFCDKTFKTSMQYLVEQVSSKTLETQSGAILALGNCYERKIIKSQNTNEGENIVNSKCFKNTIEVLVSCLSNANALILSSSCVSLGLIAKSCALPLDNNENLNKSTDSPDAKRIATDITTKQSVVNKLLEIMNNVKLATKCREKAAKCLGLLCVGENFPCNKEVMLGLLNTVKETKDVEVHFTIGESLVMAVQSIWSPEARDPWVTLPKDYTPNYHIGKTLNDENLEWLSLQLLKYADDLHPNSKQAASIWLLALLKSCIERDSIKSRLNILQNTFMNLLGENNDIVQDVASKALCLIYDYSKSEELLAALVEQLTTGRRQAVQVNDDTKLFEEGQLGQTPSGGKLSTYKELCSLASELNKPDLIYQFMQLANHNAMWNSKKGAAFGFSSIAEKCGEHLQTYLPKILPKLYRYQYDPSPNLHSSMQSIWQALVLEPQKMLEKYHNEVLEELLSNLTSGQYRVRQSCALALQDFLKGAGNRSIHDSVHSMDELWNKLFRVMDDHHEQTRIAATKTTKILSKLCIRGCDVGQGKNGVKMMEAVLPVLLNIGINSPVSEVRLISLQTISELVGAAGKQLKPFLPQLIPALLIATGELESSKLSYLSTMYGGQSQVQEVLDSARASLAKSHFTTETVSKCLQYADVSILEELIPKVVDLMKSTVALGTRVACAHFITLLTLQLRKDLQPYTGKLLAALVNGLTDRNASIRKHNALAIGHLVSTAKESSLEKLFSKIQHWYFEREDDSIRSACALTIQSIGNHNQEILKEYSDVVLPLVFFAMNAEKTPETEKTLEIWNDIWAEQSPGTESGIRHNIEPISTILKTALESPSWTMKAQAANAVSTVASKLGTSMEAKHRNALVQILIDGLSGRTWNGKENLLKALASICSNCKEAILENKEIYYNEIIDGALKESRKEEIVYKTHSLEALGNILSSLEADRFEEVYKLVESVFTKETSPKDDDDEDMSTEELGSLRENKLKLQKTVYDLLGKAWPKNSKETQAKYNEMFVEHCVACLPKTTRTVQVSIMVALCSYVDKLVLLESQDLNESECKSLDRIVKELVTALKFTLGITKYTLLRKEALNVYFSLGKKLKDTNKKEHFECLSKVFEEYLPEITKDNQPEIKSRVIDLKNLFAL